MNSPESSSARARWRELMDGHLLGELSAGESRELEAALAAHREAREDFRLRCNVDAALRKEAAVLGQGSAAEAPSSKRTPAAAGGFSWLSWRPLTAAAAGLVSGLFSASMVWAYAVPLTRGTIEQVVTVFADGFEDAQMRPERGFPKRSNEWSGDLSAPVGAEPGVMPFEGSRMVRLNPSPKRKFSYARRIMDLAEHPSIVNGQTRRLEVMASFNTPGTERSSHYQIRLAAFSEKPADLRAIWNDEPALFDTVLQHVGRNVRTEPGDFGWQTVSAVLDIPTGARSVVISLAAAGSDPAVPPTDHFLDDVQARFVITQSPLD